MREVFKMSDFKLNRDVCESFISPTKAKQVGQIFYYDILSFFKEQFANYFLSELLNFSQAKNLNVLGKAYESV